MKLESLKFLDQKKNRDPYRCEFPDGSILESQEAEDGTIDARVTRAGSIILDFQTLLPPGWRMVGRDGFKRWFKKQNHKNYRWASWMADAEYKIICVGGYKDDPRNLFSLLHEIGHANNYYNDPESQKSERYLGILQQPQSLNDEQEIELTRKVIEWSSYDERQAWAYAVLKFRLLGFEFLRNTFPTPDDLKQYIRKYLASHRRSWAEEVEEDDQFFLKELKELFDKGEYKE